MNKFIFEKNKFFTAFALESHVPRSQRKLIATISTAGIFILLLLFFYTWIQLHMPNFPQLPYAPQKLFGIILILLGIRVAIFAIERFIRSITFNKSGIVPSDSIVQRMNYFAAELWFYGVYQETNPSFIEFLSSLPQTDIGMYTLIRLGISLEEFRDFLAHYKRETSAHFDQLLSALASFPQNHEITSSDLLVLMFNQDTNLREFIISKQADEKSIRGAAEWLERCMTREDQERRWWSREVLGRIPGLAKTWAYGPVFTIMQFAIRMSDEIATLRPTEIIGRENEIKLLEDALLSQGNANVIIVGEPGAGKETIIFGLTQMIIQGKIFPELESKRVFRLSGPSLVATGKTKGETEAILIHIFNEAVRAGDIILVIEQFPEFVESLDKMGVIASQILEPYFASNAIHIIAMADTTPFRRIIESNAALMSHFEKIEILSPDEDHLVLILEDVASRVEAQARGSVVLTYPALKKISEAGIRYLVEGALPERAINLMQELVNYAAAHHITLIGPEFVAEYVGRKTKIPLGTITKEEQEKLMNLENHLHKHVINQTEAITAIANTIRRARAGIGEPKRPIGSFLFLGPTGVGKTETAKALATVYFGSEDAMMRFDMTEYQSENALERLIGSFEKNEPGILASRMRSSPYGAILLDEFEKADKKVVDLFLQILDEGFFSDAFGKSVNMRNTIIIATSNAGAQLIWHWMETGIDPTTKKSEIIAEIQQEGKFKPELLNRFDAIIIYQPLSQDHLKQVAGMMLKRLADRLKEQQDITFVITDELMNETVRQGYDPTFGARPMRRFIQNNIEKIIAEKIIRGELSRGSSITLSAENL